MNPQQQAVAAVLQKMGIPADKIDGAMIDMLVQACSAGAAPPAAKAEPPVAAPVVAPPQHQLTGNSDGGMESTMDGGNVAKHTDPTNDPEKTPMKVDTNADKADGHDYDDKDKEAKEAKFNERLSRAVALALAPLQQKLAGIELLATNATSQLAMERAAKNRAELAAFVEKHKGRLMPYELDDKVARAKGTVTVLDQLLALPDTTVATFAEGKVSPRVALMRQIENRPSKFGEYAEKMKDPAPDSPADRRREALQSSALGRKVLANEAAANKEKANWDALAQFSETITKALAASGKA